MHKHPVSLNNTQGGYRLYSQKDLERLHLILFFRELQFPLKDIPIIIDAPDYAIVLRELEELTTACKAYNHSHKPGRLPNYFHLFSNHSRDRSLLAINVRLNEIVEQLGNSRRQDILSLLNDYPVISAGAHSSPFPRRWMNIAVGIVFPVGILFYARAYFFRRRLSKDLRQMVKINKEIQYLINERIFK